MERIKKYVTVNANHNEDGSCRPVYIVLDGKKYEIDRIRQCRRAASTKVGGTGLRYTVVIMGQETFLFDEGEGKWYVEAKRDYVMHND